MEPTKRSTRKELTPVEFRKLTKPQKKVAVALDVIAQIKAQRYKANSGQYIGASRTQEEEWCKLAESREGDIQSTLSEIKYCEVCAVGSCILSVTKYENKLKWHDIGRVSSDCSSKVTDVLKKVFTGKELTILEVMFEGYYNDGGDNYGKNQMGATLADDEAKRAKLWYSKYDDEDKRLLAIMRRIVKNEGVITI
jgi:hypothetical protein